MAINYPAGWENFRRDTEESGRCRWTSYGVLSDAFEDESAYPPEIMNRIVQGLGWLAREHRWPSMFGWMCMPSGAWITFPYTSEINKNMILPTILSKDSDAIFIHNGNCEIIEIIQRITELSEDRFQKIMNTRMLDSAEKG